MALDSLPVGPEYREVPGCPGYVAGDDGTLWSRWTGGRWPKDSGRWVRVNATPTTTAGHLRVCLRTEAGFRVFEFLHRVILTTFVGPCPDGTIGCHDPDPNPANCALTNLRWGTPTDNSEDCKRHGRFARGEKMPQAKLRDEDVPEVFRLRREGVTQQEIADRFGVRRLLITRILARHRYAHVAVRDTQQKPVKGNYVRGATHHNAKLNEAKVAEMKRLRQEGWKQHALATRYGVAQCTVSDILKGKFWGHVAAETGSPSSSDTGSA